MTIFTWHPNIQQYQLWATDSDLLTCYFGIFGNNYFVTFILKDLTN